MFWFVTFWGAFTAVCGRTYLASLKEYDINDKDGRRGILLWTKIANITHWVQWVLCGVIIIRHILVK